MTSSLLRCRFATLGARLVKVNKSDVVECKIKKSLLLKLKSKFKNLFKRIFKSFSFHLIVPPAAIYLNFFLSENLPIVKFYQRKTFCFT